MAHFLEHCFDFLLIAKPGVIRANRDLHRPNFVVGVQGVQQKESGARIQESGGDGSAKRRLLTPEFWLLTPSTPLQPLIGSSSGVTKKSNISVPRTTVSTDLFPISLPTRKRWRSSIELTGAALKDIIISPSRRPDRSTGPPCSMPAIKTPDSWSRR